MPNGREAPIAYYSRTLSPAERNYSQLDKEALAAISGIKRFHEYLYGRPFTLITDHKPLLGLISGDRPTPAILSPRMLRWTEFLAAYNYKLYYKPGSSISHADALSRCPLPATVDNPIEETMVLLIDFLQNHLLTASEVARATAKDKVLARVLYWTLKGWPVGPVPGEEFKPFQMRQTELSVLRGCLLWGDRVVIPERMHLEVLKLMHEGHPGMGRMKGLARSYVWWPGMDKMIESWVATCRACQESRPNPPKAPVHEWDAPKTPWSRIHIDFAGPCHGHTYLITVDAYSKWLDIRAMRTTTSDAVITALRGLFATHGLPDVLVSDNGPQLTSNQFEMFLANHGIRHALTATGNPQANGLAERYVRVTKEALARLEGGNIQEKIDKVMFLQHITPITAINKSPAELLMGRKLRSHLDRLHPYYTPERPVDSSSKHRTFKTGDLVYAINHNGDPAWVPAQITQVTGPLSYRVQTEDGQQWKRHINQLRSRLKQTVQEKTLDKEADVNLDRIWPRGFREEPENNTISHREQGDILINQPHVADEEPRAIHNQGDTIVASEEQNTESSSNGESIRRSYRSTRKPAYLRDYIT